MQALSESAFIVKKFTKKTGTFFFVKNFTIKDKSFVSAYIVKKFTMKALSPITVGSAYICEKIHK
jgi:hypothetical protein